jgi:hypothetical protein
MADGPYGDVGLWFGDPADWFVGFRTIRIAHS